ncbi:FAD-binding and (Fe-S)-binding domain-containing protein [Alkalitalea saponilacus]|uniref:FAD/FMN-containing dehydrogenase n=1 Tax=Alkalitalea saponilacus TaxID=889453 RepID=A0A1T5BW76_9BACT|nr:FAD-binding and (Fe-S)-binding domain-containing protein [Alkalitalea saponilacus]ASB49572.1 FAD-binding oxidoreductase [Alkalitalea saponilacus]SKB51407.1 FAD/FMN-containing dehydrogenase [Alkalitalea saponilacus]
MDDPYPPFGELDNLLKGEVLTDTLSRTLYATDASVYKELPMAVVLPRDATDVSMIVRCASKHNIPLIPRGAGTSLAGQVVGNGMVVDISHHMNRIIEVNADENWVTVEPGVVLDDLNRKATEYGLFFGPETSTSNRCTLGGMVANNSCGSHSMIYGSTRDHIIEVTGFLANGEEVTFRPLQKWEFDKKCREETLEGEIYRLMREIYTDNPVRKQIRKEFPHPDVKRRNSGYALDMLLDTVPFNQDGEPFNLSKLVAGSEGTLIFITSVKLSLVPLPPPHKLLLCAHFYNLNDALLANIELVHNHAPDAVELMDKNILDLTLDNPLQRSNRFFVEGDPAALLLIEFSGHSEEEMLQKAENTLRVFRQKNMGYAWPMVTGKDINRVWALRKAGLGVLSNMKGDARPVTLIEDTAVRVDDLPAYVEDIDKMLAGYGKKCVYHAHVGSGELHIRPVLNLKNSEDIKLFRQIAEDTAKIAKKYRGALSGEHGDGRLRGEFIPLMVGEENYELMKRVKNLFDPEGIFNPGKITGTPPMDQAFRYQQVNNKFGKTHFHWAEEAGLLGAVERCSGSGDCVKSATAGGTMCPSYMGTRDEQHSTRGRANILRSFLQGQNGSETLTYQDIKEVLDLCLSCKACKSECPSSVDMAKLKAEFLQHIADTEGVSLTSRVMANLPMVNRFLFPWRRFLNPLIKSEWLKPRLNHFAGISPHRTLPSFSQQRFDVWFKKKGVVTDERPNGKVMLLADEFTNFYDSEIGVKTVLLLHRLGYDVVLAPIKETGRTQISKGFLHKAKSIVNNNLSKLYGKISDKMPLVGIEPAAILTFRDEYPDLASSEQRNFAREIAQNTLSIEEFILREMQAGRIKNRSFTNEERHIRFHAHCHQKALMNTSVIRDILSFPENYHAEEIPSGCCGMAGGFGYEEKNHHLSLKIGELTLFPEVRKTPKTTLLAASGHSCRHQIKDGTDRDSLHPVEILFEALV